MTTRRWPTPPAGPPGGWAEPGAAGAETGIALGERGGDAYLHGCRGRVSRARSDLEDDMAKHVLDRQQPADSRRAERFAEIERRRGPEGTHPAAKQLNRRPRVRDSGRRMGEFLRVEHGERA
jgi:hypothetical protein